MAKAPKLLIVSSDSQFCKAITMKLGKFDLLVLAAIDNDRATSVMSTTTVELVLVDSS